MLGGMSREMTVVVPTRDRAALLRHALASVVNGHGVSLEPQDILVVDDQSSDNTASVVAEFGVRYVRVTAGSPSKARNAGLSHVDTEFVAFLDDDDAWEPGNMAAQLTALREASDLGFAFTQAQLVGPALEPWHIFTPELRSDLAPIEQLALTDIQLGCVALRTSAVRAVGGFAEHLRYCEDWDLYMRLAMRSRFASVTGPGSLFRQREDEAADGEMRWRSFRDRERAWSGLLAAGLRLSARIRWIRARQARGFSAVHLCYSAQIAAMRGDMALATRYLVYACRISPVHAASTGRLFWGTLVRVATARFRSRSSARA